jgi:triosephosphate isomerase (TIM)
MIIANWKANGSLAANISWHKKLTQILPGNNFSDIGIASSNIHFIQIKKIFENSNLKVGLQDIDFNGGARTGSVSASMASDAGCNFSLLGHSERRYLFNEDNTLIRTKIQAAISNRIKPILCIGESEECLEEKETRDFLKSQLIGALSGVELNKHAVIAYEPIWAIGSGNTPAPKDINLIHEFIKDVVQSTSANNIEPKVLYGGSVSHKNAEAFFDEKSIDGALVGGASLKASSFADIIKIYRKVKRK